MTGIFGRVRNYLGEAIIGVGAVHTLAAGSAYVDQWKDMRDGGLWGTVETAGTGLNGEALWFAAAGLSYLFTGVLARSHIRATGTLPMSFAAGTTALAVALCVAMPASGAWMALACGVWSILVAASGRPAVAGNSAPAPKVKLRPEDLVV